MVTTEHENREMRAEQDDIVAQSRQFLSSLGSLAGPQRAEGQAIAVTLEQLGLAPALIAAAHLYPLARDGIVTVRDLAKTPLAALEPTLQGLLQFGRFSLPPDWQPGEALAVSQSEALRRMLLAVVSDARLVLVRIAEQLYRLRTAKKASPGEQRSIAIETREIYAPLANRLGVWQLKWELEDFAFRYLEPERYLQIVRALNEKRAEREAAIEAVRQAFAAELAASGIEANVTARPKHIYSIWRKMQRKESGLEHIFDIRAVRILVQSVSDCYAALGVVHNRWPYLRREFDDYIANPKENSYRSLHTAVIGPGNHVVEVQLRTQEMHRQAELGVAAHWRYKEGGGAKPAFDQKIRFLRQLLEPSDRDGDLLEQFRGDVFEDRVYALSPRGDVVEMPSGSTPLDFAYHVHTQVGHRCRGAKVNGRIVPLTYKVQMGDRIEIITGKEPQPSRDWLSPKTGYLAAARSRAKVRNWFRQQDRDQNRKQGRDVLDRELARLNVRDVATDRIAAELKFDHSDALYVALGAGDVTPTAVVNAIQRLRKEETAPPPLPAQRRRLRKRTADEQVEIHGVGDLLCTLSRCYRPVPPEDIVGYITKGRGVSIHRQDCGNFHGLYSRHPERAIDVDWRDPADETYPAELMIQAYDRQGLLRDVTSVLADEKVSVDGIQTSTNQQRMQARMELRILVPGLAALSSVIARLEQVPNVTSVRRKR
ncbi:MAG: bifunctional (p)ppGpp synthetase/guanosine-3',5'-bis(diphosphate) 3'-pyrophosphohydrolase [Woeseia sp.]